MSGKEVLVEGTDFESSWIDRAEFDPTLWGTDTHGIVIMTLNGERYGYMLMRDQWEKFKDEARRSLEGDGSTGSAYNNLIKSLSNDEAPRLGDGGLDEDVDAILQQENLMSLLHKPHYEGDDE